MTIIHGDKDHWIETFKLDRVSIANNSRLVSVHTLTKPGHFVGCSATLDHALTGGSAGNIGVGIAGVGGAELFYGDLIEVINTTIGNVSGGALIVGCHVVLFMRN